MINQYTGLAQQTGGDIPYAELELGGMGQRGAELAGGRNSYAQSQQKKDFWDKLESVGNAARGIGSGVASIYTGGISNVAADTVGGV